MKRILIVEDDRTMNRMISHLLLSEGYCTTSAYTKTEAENRLHAGAYDLAILDVNLPDGSGFDLCQTAGHRKAAPVIFLTANDLEEDIIKGYELGAADYITKPFSGAVLRHKVRAIFTMLYGMLSEPPHMRYDDGRLLIDFSAMQASLCGREITFAPLEYRMLEIFVKNKGLLLTRQKLLESLWDHQENYVDEHTLTAAISRIRVKIERDGHKYIRTVYGMGYMFLEGGARA